MISCFVAPLKALINYDGIGEAQVVQMERKIKTTSHTLIKALERIEDFMAYSAGVLIAFMVLSVCYEIVLRYFFSRPTLWVVGAVEYILFCATFLGTGWVLRKDGHIRVDVGMSFFSERGQVLLNILTSGICLISSATMAWYGVKTTHNLLVRNVMTAQDPEIPKFILILFIPLGFFFLMIESIRMGFRNLALMKNVKK